MNGSLSRAVTKDSYGIEVAMQRAWGSDESDKTGFRILTLAIVSLQPNPFLVCCLLSAADLRLLPVL
jgi:hypothetical protein